MQAAAAVTRACQMPRMAAAQRAAAQQLHSAARIGGSAQLRRQGAGMAAASRLSVVRAVATANGPVTKKASVGWWRGWTAGWRGWDGSA